VFAGTRQYGRGKIHLLIFVLGNPCTSGLISAIYFIAAFLGIITTDFQSQITPWWRERAV